MTKVSRSAAISALLRAKKSGLAYALRAPWALSCCELDLAAGKLLNALRALRTETSCCRGTHTLITGLGNKRGRNPLLFF